MLYLHETHLVAGYHEDAFEAAFRDGWMPTLAEGDDARLLWYLNLAHGSGWSYRVVTITAVRDGAAWERLALRIQRGDLQDWMRDLDTYRHDVTGKVLVPLPWSPMVDLDLMSVPADGVEHEPVVYMEDTMWPFEDRFLDYVDASGSVYAKSLVHRELGGAAVPRDRSRLPTGVRLTPATRGGPDATDPRSRPLARSAHHRHPRGDAGTGHLDARRAPAARPLGEPAASHRNVVPVPGRRGRGRRLMLFVHEVHQVAGANEDEFETAFREGWMPTLAEGDDARLLWYMNHAHGSGASYNVVTITGVRDGAAWERLNRRIQAGDLRDWIREVDGYRHDVTAKTLLPVDWSPIQEVDFATVPTDGREHELHLFMEDTGWPTSPLDDYIKAWDDIYRQPLLAYADDMRAIPIDIQACFQIAHGSHLRREAILWQYIPDPQTVAHLITTDLPIERRVPGTYMYDALAFRDQWKSRLLRTAAWSPLY